MNDEKKPEQPALRQSPENLPTPAGVVESVGARTGLFGVKGSGDTSGYGGLVKPVVFLVNAQRPYGGWLDTVADGLDCLVDRLVIHRGEIISHLSLDLPFAAAETLRSDTRLRFEFAPGFSDTPHNSQ